MAGAYMAKAAAAVASTTPPGWTVGWIHPGPWPPGYVPTLSYTLVTGATYSPGNTHLATATLYDQVSYETGAPDNPMTWQATIDGVAVELKEDGDDDWVEVLQTDHSAIGSYGAAPSLRFNVGVDDNGKTIVLTGNSTPFNFSPPIAAPDEIEAEITVVVPMYATLEVTMTAGAWQAPGGEVSEIREAYILFHDSSQYGVAPSGYLQAVGVVNVNPQVWSYYHDSDEADDFDMYVPLGGGPLSTSYDSEWVEGTSPLETLKIKCPELEAGITYACEHRHNTTDYTGGVTYDYTFKLYDAADTLLDTKTKQVVVPADHSEAGPTVWLTVDADTGDITVVNP